MKRLVSVLFLVSTISSFAQTPDPPAVSAEIVVTASAIPERVDETPATATVFTREEIEAREARDVADVLREVPGVTVNRTGSMGKATSLFIRGGSSKQALVLWNGIEVNYPYHSGYNFGQLSTAGVEKIEVVRGPFSALYGSEAVSGVVNVLTERDHNGGTLDLSVGERGLFSGAISGGVAFDDWSLHAAAERRQDSGFNPNDDFKGSSLIGGATFNVTPQLSLGLLARHSVYDLGIPFNANASGTAFEPSPSRREEGVETQLAVPIHFNSGRISYEFRLSESRRDEIFDDPAGTFGPEHTVNESRVRTARGTVRGTTPAGTITVGGEYEESLVDHESAFALIDSRDRTSHAAFVEDRLSIPAGAASIEVAAGLRLDDFDTFGSQLSPRLAVAWVRSGHKLRAAYGEGFRAPGIGELYTPFYGNPELEAEQSRTIEAGYERWFADGNGTASVTLFDSQYDDLIFFSSAFRYENINAASARGVELAARRRFGAFTAGASYTWLDAEDEETGEELLRRPRHSGSATLGYDAGFGSALVVLTHTGSRNDVTDLLPYGTVRNKAFTMADIVFHYHRGGLRPFLKIENVTAERYQEAFGYDSPGRRVVVGMRYGISN
ncbi:MAG TPA: TonB-dependent receptor [Thermoanaerobaculia bacterium]|nr:TonB-dependent receptor [Thermoanaerobaculia bacterium]